MERGVRPCCCAVKGAARGHIVRLDALRPVVIAAICPGDKHLGFLCIYIQNGSDRKCERDRSARKEHVT